MNAYRMPLDTWIRVWMYTLLGCLVFLAAQVSGARPRFDTSTDMGLVLVPADAEIDSVIFRLRATDQDADFPLVFDITATVTPIVRIENLPCTLYNKVCQANVILTRRLIAGRLHDFAVRVKDSKGDSNSMQATISVTNATTRRDTIFPHIPALIMVPEDTKPGKELDYILVRSNQWSGKPVYIELWQPKELFTIRQRQTPAETRGVITLIGELDFETQSMYTLTIYATDPYTEPKKDTRNIAGLHLVVVVQDVQDVPPIFTLAPPLTKINNTVKPGDVILRVHAEDGDKGVPREVTYGLVSEGNPFTPFFNITETTGEIILARPLEELTQITRVGAPVVLTVVAEEIRRSTMEPPAQATVVEVGLLLGEPGNSPPFFDNDNYIAWIDENAEPGSVITFTEHYSTKVHDEDIGKAGVFALKLDNNNGTFEISPNVAERTANFIITVRDNSLIDYEIHKSLRFKIIAQEVGPATNLSATVPATIFLRDVNDNAPEFEVSSYEVTLSENATAGSRVIQVHATDKDTGFFGRIQYTRIIGTGSEAFDVNPDTGIITVSMETSALDREITPTIRLFVEARDEDGKGLRGTVPLIVNLLDVNDNAPTFESASYKFTLNEDQTNFTTPAIIKAFDADAEPPNNEVRYEIIHGNYENKFYLDEITGELFLREPINKVRRTRHNPYQNFAAIFRNEVVKVQKTFENMLPSSTMTPIDATIDDAKMNETSNATIETPKIRKKREDDEVLFTLTARAYDLGVPHLSGVTQVSILKGPVVGARIVMFVVSGENPDPMRTAEALAAITGGRITVLETRPYTSADIPSGTGMNVPSLEGVKKSIVVARVEPNGARTSLVDIERIRAALAENGVAVIDGDMPTGSVKPVTTNHNTNTNINLTRSVTSEEVTIYKAENRLLFWLLIILGLLMLIALIALIICCICPGCPFYMAPRKRRVHSSETLIARSDGRPRRHLHRKHARMLEASWSGKKQAWSADPTRRNWQFNRRNQKASGLASLPGDVHIVDRDHEISEKAASLRLRDGPIQMYFTDPSRRPDEERIYIEDFEGFRGRDYAHVDIGTVRHHDVERGTDMARVNEDEQRACQQAKFVREQHFYRDGNAEVLRLVTRGQMEEGMTVHPLHRPQTLVIDQGQSGGYRVDGKDILLQRFIEDQKIRHASEGEHNLHDSLQDIERRSMESHHRQKEAINIQQQQQQQQQQQKVLLIPERLEEDHRQHIEELGPEVQRLIIDHGPFEKTARFESKDSQEILPEATVLVHGPISTTLGEKSKEPTSRQSVDFQHYSIHDVELARQNALLTRLLLERDVREVGGGAMIDSASYLETQSLPGQVAIATQTDRTAATQTELPNRSRSDNDESEEDARMRKKMKSKKRHGDGEPRRIRTLWMKSPIQEEEMLYCTEKRTNTMRKKMKESRRISLEPEVLQAISDSLDENGEPPITARRRDVHEKDSVSREESRNEEENSRLEDSSSTEFTLRDGRRVVSEKREARSVADEDAKGHHRAGKRENVVEPSFRILEREMSSLSKKLSKLAGKKLLRYSNGSETDSLEQTKIVPMDPKKNDKKMEVQVGAAKKLTTGVEVTKSKRSKSTSRVSTSEALSAKEQVKIREEVVGDLKSRHVSKYRKSQTISTGSSDFEDAVEKIKKQAPSVTSAEKHKPLPTKTYHTKLKRQNKVEHKESTRGTPLALSQETVEQKDSSDTTSKESIKSGKSERESMKMTKYDSVTKTASDSLSSDNSKNTKAKRKGKPHPDAGKKSSAVTSERSSRISQEETATPITSQAKSTVESTVIEIKETSSEVPELRMKIDSEVANVQSSDRVLTPAMSPVIPELALKIVSEAANSEFLQAPESPEMSEPKIEVVPEPVEMQNNLRVPTAAAGTLQTPELSIKIVPATVTSEILKTPVRSPEVPELKIVPGDMKMQESEQILTPAPSSEVSETLTSEIVQTPFLSPNAADVTTKIGFETVEIEKSDKFQMADDKERTNEASQAAISLPKKSNDEEPPKFFETVENVVLTIPKEELVDVLNHEMKDSMESLQAHEHSITETVGTIEDNVLGSMAEGVGTIKDIVLGSVAMQSQNKEIPDNTQKCELPKPNELERSDHFEEWEEEWKAVLTDAESDRENVTKKAAVTEQFEDGGTFSDNFDSFCGTDIHLKDSLETRAKEGEISYETLQSQSSEDQITEERQTHIEDNDEKNNEAATTDESKEISMVSPISTVQHVEESKPSQASPIDIITPCQSSAELSDLAEKVTSPTPTPIPLEIVTKDTNIQISSSNVIDVSVPELKTEMIIPREEPPTKHVAQPIKSSKVEKIDLSLDKPDDDILPKVSSPDIITSDDKTLNPQESTELVLTEAETRIVSPKFPSITPEEIKVETASQKEFGIADSLFVDAKLLKISPRFEKGVVNDSTVQDSSEEQSADIRKTIDIQVPSVNLVELTGVLLDDEDDSDSSEASRETMLTARPYGTPRHRAIPSRIENIEAAEASKAKSAGLEIATHLLGTDISIETSRTTTETGKSVQNAQKENSHASVDKQNESLREKTSTEIEVEGKSSVSQKIVIEAISPTQDISLPLPITATMKAAEQDVEAQSKPIDVENSAKIIEDESKTLDRTASPEEDPKTSASDKVQQLYQIRQEKLPADADDGFASLPEMDEPVKRLDIPKLPEEAMHLPVELGKTAVIGKIVKTPTNGTKSVASTGKDTKRGGKQRESLRKDVSKKSVKVPLKAASPKKEAKAKRLKEESSKIGKQSIVAGQFARFRDTKRQTRPVQPQIEEQTDSLYQSDKIRRTLRKNDPPEKDAQQDKIKPEEVKKASSSGETKKLTSKRQIESREKQEKLKDSRAKKIQDKAVKVDKGNNVIPESNIEKAVKSDATEKLEDRQIIVKPKDQHRKNGEGSVDYFKENEPISIGKTDESSIQNPILNHPKMEVNETKDAKGAEASDKSKELSVENKSEHEYIVDETVEPEVPDHSMLDPQKKESTIPGSDENKKLSIESKSEHDKIIDKPVETEVSDHSIPEVKESPSLEIFVLSSLVSEPDKIPKKLSVASGQAEEATEADNGSKGVAIQSESTEDRVDERTEKVRDAEEGTLSGTNAPEKCLPTGVTTEKASPRRAGKSRKESEVTVIESQSRYMEWYKQKREEMERKRQERKDTDEEEERPKWLRKSTRQRWFKGGPDEKKIFDPKFGEATPRRKKIKPLVNVESEQLKAIVRQGRKLRKAQGDGEDDPQIIIFAPEKPSTPLSTNPAQSRLHHHHHLVQHSEYNYEKLPVTPFYLHPPPVPHPSPEMSAQRFEDLCPEQYRSLPTESGCPTETFDSGIIVQQPQGSNKLRHQQLLEKKSVFDIAYSEAAPSHLRSDSTTPPS